jgi:ABC-type dipeptide/oligopeptide/nickel transport system ATPase subunit
MSNLEVKKLQNDLDIKPLSKSNVKQLDDIPYPLPNFSDRSNFIMSIIAPTGSGKSVLISNIVRKFYYKQFDKVYFCSSNVSDDNKIYDNAYNSIEFDETRIFQDINDDIVNYIKMDIETDDDFDKKDFRTLLIIDDLITSIANRKNKEVIKFILKSRHIKCSIIMISHKYNMLPTIIRNNLTDIIIFRTKSKQEIETIYKGIIDLEIDKFFDFYKYSTNEPFNFLYVKLNKNPQLYYHNFTEQLV